jgi:hypothetical protein
MTLSVSLTASSEKICEFSKTCSSTCIISEMLVSILIPYLTCFAWVSLDVSSINSSWIVSITLIRKPKTLSRLVLTNILPQPLLLVELVLNARIQSSAITYKLDDVSEGSGPIVWKIRGKKWQNEC